MKADWRQYPNFSKEEFDCKHTGNNEMQHLFMMQLQHLRNLYGKPMRITSGYRDPKHPIEARKNGISGAHTTGMACDIAVEFGDAYTLLKLAMEVGFTGIGIQQKGSGRFIHLDTIPSSPSQPRPHIWSY
jgi:zinc D-Ala-D-Ala carboxypeptidase